MRALISKVTKNINKLDNPKSLIQLIDLQRQPTPEKQLFRVNEIVQQTSIPFRSLIQKPQSNAVLLDPDRSTVRYIRPYLRSIVNNLVSNAVKYRDTLIPANQDYDTKLVNFCVLTLEDNGQGIDLQNTALSYSSHFAALPATLME